MRYKLHGRSGLRVSELCLGAMTFGSDWGWGADDEESRAMFDAFADAGGTFIDTAHVYTEGASERLVGEFMTPRPVAIAGDRLAVEVLQLLEHSRIDDLVVVDENLRPIGLIDTQDLTRLKLL